MKCCNCRPALTWQSSCFFPALVCQLYIPALNDNGGLRELNNEKQAQFKKRQNRDTKLSQVDLTILYTFHDISFECTVNINTAIIIWCTFSESKYSRPSNKLYSSSLLGLGNSIAINLTLLG